MVTVPVPPLEDQWVVMSVEKVPLRSLDVSFLRVMSPMRVWLEASDVVVFFLCVLSTDRTRETCQQLGFIVYLSGWLCIK